MRRFWYLMLAAAISSCTLLRDLLREEPPLGVAHSAVPIRGTEAMAAGVAMQDYIQAETAFAEDAGKLGPDGGVLPADPDAGWLQADVDHARCWLNPSNFTAWVDLDGGPGPRRWHVSVLPSGTCNWPTYGGGAEYEVDGESFQILRRELSE